MPDTGWITATGEGEQNINGGTDVTVITTQIDVTSVTNPRIRQIGSVAPVRLQYAGSVQLLTHDIDSTGASVYIPSVSFALNFMQMEFLTPSAMAGNSFWTKVKWLLPTGITVKIKVFW